MIQVNDLTEITENDVYKLVDKIVPELNSRQELWKRIHRKSNLNELVFDISGKKNNITFEKYIWLISSGFLGGKAPSYSVSDTVDEEKKKLIKEILGKEIKDVDYKKKMEIVIDYITKYNDDGTEHYNLMCDALGLRGAYEIIYENEHNEIVYSKLDPLQTVAIWDYEVPRNLIGIVNIHEEQNVNSQLTTIVEIIDKNGKRKFEKNGKVYDKASKKKVDKYIEKVDEFRPNNWDDVPAFAVELDESIFESVVDTIIKYEQLIKNNSNMFQYNDEAKLSIYGYQAENPMTITETYEEDGETKTRTIVNPARQLEDEKILKSKTLYFPDKSLSGAEWILKDINDTATQNTLKTYIDLILMMSGVPNTFDLGFTNADNASAIDRKFFSLSMITVNLIQQFKQGYLRRWELIFGRINLKKNLDFDFRDITVDLPVNLPSNESEVIDMWLKLQGIVSDETIVERLPLGLDYTSERNKLEEQNQGVVIENGNMEISRIEDDGTKQTIQEDIETDTEQSANNIQ